MAQTPIEDDTLEKIHSYVKDMDINGTYVDMTEQLLMFRPENPIRFMIDYLSFKHNETVRLLFPTKQIDQRFHVFYFYFFWNVRFLIASFTFFCFFVSSC